MAMRLRWVVSGRDRVCDCVRLSVDGIGYAIALGCQWTGSGMRLRWVVNGRDRVCDCVGLLVDWTGEDAQALIEIAAEQKKRPAQARHHSLHPISATSSQMPPMSARTSHSSADTLEIPQRSPSGELDKVEDEGGSRNRFMKWLGLSQSRRDSKKPRRMSTFS
ncbi:unnamed protein product [Toxocara canis]|uniref:Uncharacterized protein n=1 Tax=Toxocara canis TaxID=6265 RepID=A0A183UL65_TOXCA|nr:unnamed protein product [Toxocara canis]